MHTPTALIAGSSSGIGQQCVNTFLECGWRVVGISRSQSQVKNANFIGISADLTNEETTRDVLKAISMDWGNINAVIHSIGDIYEEKPMANMEWSRWVKSMNLCVGSAFNLVKNSFETIKSCQGSYTFIASIGARKPYPGISDYCAAKAALVSFTQSLAIELAPAGARANSISPAVVQTPLFEKSPYSLEEASSWHPLKRVGTPHEIALLAEYLASTKSNWITGQDYVIDGGMLL